MRKEMTGDLKKSQKSKVEGRRTKNRNTLHFRPSTFDLRLFLSQFVQCRLSLAGVPIRVQLPQAGRQGGQVGRGETTAGDCLVAFVDPGHANVEASRQEFDQRIFAAFDAIRTYIAISG